MVERLVMSLGGLKPSQSSVASIMSLETRFFDTGVGKDSNIRALFLEGGVSQVGASRERNSRVSSLSFFKPYTASKLRDQCLVGIFPLTDLSPLTPFLRANTFLIDILLAWT